MKLLLLGSTGPTGQHVLRYALDGGDEVTVLVRNPARLGILARRVRFVQGDARSADYLAQAMAGQDAVVSALGQGHRTIRRTGLFTEAAAAVTGAMARTGVRRLVWMSSFGVGGTFAQASWVQRLSYRTLLRGIFADKAEAEKVLRAADIDLTVVYPTALTNQPPAGSYRTGQALRMKGMATIARADVAGFMIQAVRSPDWSGRDAIVSN